MKQTDQLLSNVDVTQYNLIRNGAAYYVDSSCKSSDNIVFHIGLKDSMLYCVTNHSSYEVGAGHHIEFDRTQVYTGLLTGIGSCIAYIENGIFLQIYSIGSKKILQQKFEDVLSRLVSILFVQSPKTTSIRSTTFGKLSSHGFQSHFDGINSTHNLHDSSNNTSTSRSSNKSNDNNGHLTSELLKLQHDSSATSSNRDCFNEISKLCIDDCDADDGNRNNNEHDECYFSNNEIEIVPYLFQVKRLFIEKEECLPYLLIELFNGCVILHVPSVEFVIIFPNVDSDLIDIFYVSCYNEENVRLSKYSTLVFVYQCGIYIYEIDDYLLAESLAKHMFKGAFYAVSTLKNCHDAYQLFSNVLSSTNIVTMSYYKQFNCMINCAKLINNKIIALTTDGIIRFDCFTYTIETYNVCDIFSDLLNSHFAVIKLDECSIGIITLSHDNIVVYKQQLNSSEPIELLSRLMITTNNSINNIEYFANNDELLLDYDECLYSVKNFKKLINSKQQVKG